MRTIRDMESGECRWVGRPDIHVYCRNPMAPIIGPTGRPGWRRDPEAARYRVVCPDAGLEDGTDWMTAGAVLAVVDRILADE